MDLLAQSEPVWRTWGEATIWLAAIFAALGALSRTKPIRWLFRRLVSEPFTQWFRETGGEIIEEKVGKEFTSNGGASLRDAIDTLRSGQDDLSEWAGEAKVAQVELVAGQDSLKECQTRLAEAIESTAEQITEVNSAVVAISASVGTTLADHGKRITAVEDTHTEVLEAIAKLHECMDRRLGAKADGQEEPT